MVAILGTYADKRRCRSQDVTPHASGGQDIRGLRASIGRWLPGDARFLSSGDPEAAGTAGRTDDAGRSERRPTGVERLDHSGIDRRAGAWSDRPQCRVAGVRALSARRVPEYRHRRHRRARRWSSELTCVLRPYDRVGRIALASGLSASFLVRAGGATIRHE
jgi:hypothetical protein